MVYPNDQHDKYGIVDAVEVKRIVGLKSVFNSPNAQYFKNEH